MKLDYVRKAYTPYGGAERYRPQLIGRLCRQGHEVQGFANRWDEGRKIASGGKRDAGPFFHRVPAINIPSFLKALSLAWSSRRILRKEPFDRIHLFERTPYPDIYRAGDGCQREWLPQRKEIAPWFKRLSFPINPRHRSLI